MTKIKNAVKIYVLLQDPRPTDEKVALLAERYCGAPGDYTVSRTNEGKPYFANVKDVFFSVSHSGEYFACALGSFEIGLDVQMQTIKKHESIEAAAEHYKRLAKRFFHPDEVKYVENGNVNSFFDVWCAKESYSKYTGQGIDRYFGKYSVIPEDPADIMHGKWQAMGKYFVRAVLDDRYALCVCTGVEAEIDIEYVSI